MARVAKPAHLLVRTASLCDAGSIQRAIFV
jgi:hypothetical protein